MSGPRSRLEFVVAERKKESKMKIYKYAINYFCDIATYYTYYAERGYSNFNCLLATHFSSYDEAYEFLRENEEKFIGTTAHTYRYSRNYPMIKEVVIDKISTIEFIEQFNEHYTKIDIKNLWNEREKGLLRE